MSKKTGSMGGPWVVLNKPKPHPVADIYAFWGDPPPELSERCRYWLAQIERGWRPNKHIRRNGYDSAASWYGVYVWEMINAIYPAVSS